jgi:pimeloyl-ACP methyl ester carboxylesterase
VNRTALLCLGLAALALGGCRRVVISGWAQVDRPDRPVATQYQARFTHRPFDTHGFSCAELSLAPTGPVLVLVPGIRGDGVEFEEALPTLAASRPAAMFMFRWGVLEKVSGMAEELAYGLSRLLACRPKDKVVVLAHSAGGIIVATAASLIIVPRESPDDALTILTVASPLAGTIARHPAPTEFKREPHFLLGMATRIASYPSPPRGVRAVHLRTSWPADPLMERAGDFVPHDPEVGIPGARQVDLPKELGHDEALVHVAWKLADGTWTRWFDQGVQPGTATADR